MAPLERTEWPPSAPPSRARVLVLWAHMDVTRPRDVLRRARMYPLPVHVRRVWLAAFSPAEAWRVPVPDVDFQHGMGLPVAAGAVIRPGGECG